MTTAFAKEDIVEERRFSLSNVDEHNNKFWNIVLLKDGTVVTHWGLQGTAGQKKSFPHAGRAFMEKKIREKTSSSHKGGAYIENKVLDAPRAARPASPQMASREHVRQRAVAEIAKGHGVLSDLVSYLTDVNIHQIAEWSGGQITYNDTTGLFQTPQGVITLDQINDARGVLNGIAALAARGIFDGPEFKPLVNRYLSLVPQAGLMRKFDFRQMFGTGRNSGLQHQNDMLDALATSYAAVIAQPVPKADTKTKDSPCLFKVDLSPVNHDGEEFTDARNFYHRTKGAHSDVQHLDVKKVFTLRIDAMAVAFLKRGVKVGNVMRLWHGTKASNVLSILKGGMVVPPESSPHVTARMFGDGLYFSDQSTKSIRYATGAWGRGGDVRRVFMFLVDVAMGKPYYPERDVRRIPAGYDSCFARGGHVNSSMAGGILRNNEMIVYDSAQVNPVYLVEFSDRGR